MDPREFLGKGIKFPLQVDPKTGKIAVSSYEENISESIGIILRTYQGERVMLPSFGCTTEDYVFNSERDLQILGFTGILQDTLKTQEPRITDVKVDSETQDVPEGTLLLNVSYTIRSTNNRYSHVYPFYLDEGNKEGGEL